MATCLLLPADMCHLRHLTVLCIQLSLTFCQSVSVLVYLFICSFFFFCLPLNNVLCHCDDLSDRLCFVFAVCDNQPKQGQKKKTKKKQHCVAGSTASPCSHSAVFTNTVLILNLILIVVLILAAKPWSSHSSTDYISFPRIGQNWPLPHN